MTEETPKGELALRTLAMPADTNPAGDIFGGWVLSQMDIAGGIITKRIAKGRTVTIAVDSMIFLLPVHVGDTICCYVDVIKQGRSSVKTKVEVWASRQYEGGRVKVTEGTFTYVAVCSSGKPRALDTEYV